MNTFQLVERPTTFGERTAIIDSKAAYSYKQLVSYSNNVANALLRSCTDLKEERIAFMVSPGFQYVGVQWGIWKSGAIGVPLCTSHPAESLKYAIEQSQASIVIAQPAYLSLLRPVIGNATLLSTEQLQSDQPVTPVTLNLDRRAMILYTSGTTNKPKGVVLTFGNIQAQIESLVKAWEWTENDHILNVLPLHHVHGIVNITCCALWSGATVQFLPKFNENDVFGLFKQGDINLFMAVPTIYYKLIEHYKTLQPSEQEIITTAMKQFRLMVSGSAALPIPTLEKWEKISGQTLLERYGMTEIGMALSNPYRGQRIPGQVGLPLPGVQVRLKKENGESVEKGESGEIQIKGETVFTEYWRNEEASRAAFQDNWFKSGDIATIVDGRYKILGRNSVDIIKSGGYKISALEIEEVLLSHPDIQECAVVGIDDEEWGEIVVSAIVTSKEIEHDALNEWLSYKLPKYKIPRAYKEVSSLPRNALGKVTKNVLKKEKYI